MIRIFRFVFYTLHLFLYIHIVRGKLVSLDRIARSRTRQRTPLGADSKIYQLRRGGSLKVK